MIKFIAQLDKNTKEVLHIWETLKEITEFYNCGYFAVANAVDMKKSKNSMGYLWVTKDKIMQPYIKNTEDKFVLFKSGKFHKIYDHLGTLCRDMCITEELVKGLLDGTMNHKIYSIKILQNNSLDYFDM